MKRILNLLTIVLLAGSITLPIVSLRAQDPGQPGSCSCKQFPFYYCKADGIDTTQYVVCTDNPNSTPPGMPGAKVVRIGSGVGDYPIIGCIKGGNTFNTGWVTVGDSLYPTVNISGEYEDPYLQYSYGFETNPGDGGGIGWYLHDFVDAKDTNDFTAGQTAPVDNQLYASYQCLDPGKHVDGNIDCCIHVIFETDPTFYITKGINPATGSLGYTWMPINTTNCERNTCSEEIYINCTPNFFYADGDSTETQTKLYRGYVCFAPTSVAPGAGGYSIPWGPQDPVGASGNFATGSWWDANGYHNSANVYYYNAYDFPTIMLHEWGHAMGLPDRNAAGNCGDADPNSIMTTPLAGGVVRRTTSADDCCWLQKLYRASELPPCSTDPPAFVEEIKPSDIDLGQAHPNPSSGGSTFEVTTDRNLDISLMLYDVLGKPVLTIADNRHLAPGTYSYTIPDNLPSGNYIYSLRAGDVVLSKEMTVIK